MSDTNTNTHFLVEIPEEKRDELRDFVQGLNPGAENPMEMALGEGNRTAPMDTAELFYGELLEYRPGMTPWDELEQSTRRGIASMLVDNRDFQFSDLYGVDWEEVSGLIRECYPETCGGEEK